MKKTYLLLILIVFLSGCMNTGDIDTAVKPGNEGYIMGNGSTAVLLTHGLAASPYELKELAEYLADKGLTVQVVRLAGHGTSIEDLENTTWEGWYDDFENAFLNLSKTKEKVYVGGMSLGGALALYLAEQHDAAGVISLGSPVYFVDGRVKYAWLWKYFIKGEKRIIQEDLKQYYYDFFPSSSVAEMMELVNIYSKQLDKITEPVLIMQFMNDSRVKKESADFIYKNVASKQKDILWINGIGHVLTIKNQNKEINKTFEKIYDFILRT